MFRKLLPPLVVLACAIAAGEWLRANSLSRPLSAEELEAHLRSKFDLREVALTPQPEGRFEGTGVNHKGRSYRFSVMQSSDSRTVIAEYKGTGWADFDHKSLTSTAFSDNSYVYLLLAFGCLISVGKVLRDDSRTRRIPHPARPVAPRPEHQGAIPSRG